MTLLQFSVCLHSLRRKRLGITADYTLYNARKGVKRCHKLGENRIIVIHGRKGGNEIPDPPGRICRVGNNACFIQTNGQN